MEISMTCLMALLVVMIACFLWKCAFTAHEVYVAVITIVGPSLNADLAHKFVRDGLVTDDGEHRDVAI